MRKNQRGFGGVAILLIILAVLAIGGSAYYVWNQSKKDEKPAAQTTQSAESTPANSTTQTTVTNKNVVEIKELGIKITVPDSIKDLTYTIKSSKTDDDRDLLIAYLSTQKLTNLDPNCASSAGSPLGALGRVNGNFDYDAQIVHTSLVKQFGTFYIDYSPSQAACSEDSRTIQIASDVKVDITNSLPSIEEL